jgi:hypothetical protein
MRGAARKRRIGAELIGAPPPPSTFGSNGSIN